jgi:hypothetical protein
VRVCGWGEGRGACAGGGMGGGDVDAVSDAFALRKIEAARCALPRLVEDPV